MPASTAPFYVVAAHIVPRTSFQPLVSSVQRLRELWRATILLVNEQYFNPNNNPNQPPSPTYTTSITGSSFDGVTVQAATLLWPEEFHSCTSSGMNGHLRGLPNDQNMYNFLIAGLGMGSPGGGYSMRTAVDWSIFNRLEGVDFLGLSTVNRAHAAETSKFSAP